MDFKRLSELEETSTKKIEKRKKRVGVIERRRQKEREKWRERERNGKNESVREISKIKEEEWEEEVWPSSAFKLQLSWQRRAKTVMQKSWFLIIVPLEMQWVSYCLIVDAKASGIMLACTLQKARRKAPLYADLIWNFVRIHLSLLLSSSLLSSFIFSVPFAAHVHACFVL